MSGIEMRKVFGETLIDVMSKNERVVVVDADLAGALGSKQIDNVYPERHFDIGIQEANMASFAAGLSTVGLLPVIVTFTPFASRRIADQAMVSIAFAQRPVTIIGGDPGVSAQLNGGTHMSFEDVAIMRSMAGMKVVEPADAASLRVLLPQAIADPKPVYVRLFRKVRPDIYPPDCHLTLGKAETLRAGRDVTIVGSGIMVAEALSAAQTLAEEGIEAEVIDLHTIKPIDAKAILASAQKTGAVVTCDNASVVGGIGDTVSEVLNETHPVPVIRIGVHDEVGQVGSLPYLLSQYRLDAPAIVEAAHRAINIR